MPARTLFLGIDVSTTGAKALLIDGAGTVVATASTALNVSTPRPLWSEQDPLDWWQGAVASIRHALADAGASGADVTAIGLTGQMHGLTLLDKNNEVLRPAILWNDQRTGAECDDMTELVGFARLLADHRQQGAHRLHRAEDPLGAQARAGDLRPHRPHLAAQRLCPLPIDRGVRGR